MPTITTSIGTDSRDYSTQTLWEADLDNAGVYSAADDALGERYNDSVFDEGFNINGGGTIGLNSITLSTATGERHNGTAGTGARNVDTVARTLSFGGTITVTEEFFEWDHNNTGQNNPIQCNSGTSNITVQNILLHDNNRGTGVARGIRATAGTVGLTCHNVIIYDISTDDAANQAVTGLAMTGDGTQNANNVTVHNCFNDNGTGQLNQISIDDTAGNTLRNCISMDPSGTSSGTMRCFSPTSFSNATVSNNYASDTTGSGTDTLNSQSSATTFISTTNGSEDYHLMPSANAVDAGTDLGTTPTGVNIDIDGLDRDATNAVWDMGADEALIAGGAAGAFISAILEED